MARLGAVLMVATIVRVALFNGAFGSDDGVYYARALDVASGQWTSSNYNGALRYGFNLPAGAFVALLGPSLWVANLWPLLCSLAEILLVYAFAHALGGQRLASAASMLLACAPLHVAVATRIHADPVVACFLTAGVVLSYFGWRDRRASHLLAAGVALGGVYWAKELAAVTYFALIPLLWFFVGRWRDLAIVIFGIVFMLILHGVLMLIVAGHPLHLVRTVLAAVTHQFIEGGAGEDSASYYLRYLFVDVRHTALLGWFAAFGVVALGVSMRSDQGKGMPIQAEKVACGFLLVWLLGLLLVLSVFPVSLWPMRFTMKQSNYISLFLAPLSLVAAFALQRFGPRLRVALLILACLIGLALAALQQADYRAFTSIGKAAAVWAEGQADVELLGSQNNANVARLWWRAQHDGTDAHPVRALVSWGAADVSSRAHDSPRPMKVIFDPLTQAWPGSRPAVTKPLPCWEPAVELHPINLGLGNDFAGLLAKLFKMPGVAPTERFAATFAKLSKPDPATIFSVQGQDPWCGLRTAGSKQ